jgi:hypothetical protein
MTRIYLEVLLEKIAEERNNTTKYCTPINITFTPDFSTTFVRNEQLTTPPPSPPTRNEQINIGTEETSLPIEKEKGKGRELIQNWYPSNVTSTIDNYQLRNQESPEEEENENIWTSEEIITPVEEEFNYDKKENTSWFNEPTQSGTSNWPAEINNKDTTNTYADICRGPQDKEKKRVKWAQQIEEYKDTTETYTPPKKQKKFRLCGYQTNLGKETYSCGCNARKLKIAFEEWKKWKGKVL